jgi:Trm5-related predicted tRNA methylase
MSKRKSSKSHFDDNTLDDNTLDEMKKYYKIENHDDLLKYIKINRPIIDDPDAEV